MTISWAIIGFLLFSSVLHYHCLQLPTVPSLPKSVTDIPGVAQAAEAFQSVPSSLPKSAADIPGVAQAAEAFQSVPSSLPKSAADIPGVAQAAEVFQSVPIPGLTKGDSSEREYDEYEDPDTYEPDVGLISSDPDKIRFLLYSDSSNPSSFEVLEYGNIESVQRSSYDPSKPTKFLVHGFQNNYNSSFPQNVKNAYLTRISEHPYNVIVVDWGLLAIPNAPFIAPVFYPFAVNNVWKSGIRLGEFISWLKNETLIDLNKVHIVGFSLGSHVSGRAGNWVQEIYGQRVLRITALDPAGPEFYTGIFARKITKDDADYVDAIHTNAGQLGMWKNVGKADFYVNGGTGPQPGCLGFDSVQKVYKSVTGTVTGSCSHQMATKFYARTIMDGIRRTDDLKQCSCDSATQYKLTSSCCETQVVFGEYSPPETSGTHYIKYEI